MVLGENGQKVLPVLLELDNFDIFRCTSVDAMHAVYIGVFKTFFGFWFHSPRKPYYVAPVGQRLAEEVMASIVGIDAITRGPRKISEAGNWKASEWKNFGFIYSPLILMELVARNHLHQKYLDHWLLLLEGLSLLNSTSISAQDIGQSSLLLTQFLVQMPDLYSKRNCGFNFHLLLHLPEKVKYIGPMWQTSLFANESYNSVILNCYRKGSKGIVIQIAERLQWLHSISKMYTRLDGMMQSSVAFEMAEQLYSIKKSPVLEQCGKGVKQNLRSLLLSKGWNETNDGIINFINAQECF